MTNPAKLAAQIRFHLSEMGARNSFHEFEHLSRYIARARIYSNILPATGPVSAGGDEGADFETFRSDIRPSSDFAQRSSGDRRVVFAVSLEKKIAAKIRKDVKGIAGRGNVDEIAYFCEANLPIALRKKLIREAGIPLQIFDGIAIAEFLAEPDLLWIAQEYLHVSAEIAPLTTELDDEYAALRKEWKTREIVAISHADFVSVKMGLRSAAHKVKLAPDLSFWLRKMAAFLNEGAPRDLHRSACYEIALAHLRGRGEITDQLGHVEDYFADLQDFAYQGDLTNAVTLLQFCAGAQRTGAFDVPDEWVNSRRNAIDTVLSVELANSTGPGRTAGLLFITGMMAILPSSKLEAVAGFGSAIAQWNTMLDEATKAPLYPLEPFADYLLEIINIVGDAPELADLAARNDALLAKRLGAVAAGEKAIARAKSFIAKDNPVAAIRELQRAKSNWMSGERLVQSLEVLVLLARLYRNLGLAYAAKYHAGLAAYLALHETEDDAHRFYARALAVVLDAEDVAGNSFGFMQLLNLHLAAHLKLDDYPLDPILHPEVHADVSQMTALLGLLDRCDPSSRRAVDAISQYWPPFFRDLIWKSASDREAFWNKNDLSQVWTELESNSLDRPFGDLGERRLVSWQACGISWEVEFQNDYATTAAAEQLLAALQGIACAAGGRDLGIVSSKVTIGVAVSPECEALTIADASSDMDFLVTIPAFDRGAEDLSKVAALFAAAVGLASIFEPERLMQAFDGSMLVACFIGRPYAEIYRNLMPEDGFRSDIRSESTPPAIDRPFVSRAGGGVPWFDALLPEVDAERARMDAQSRYDKALSSIQYTLAAAKSDAGANALLVEMHERGMTDWEILSILNNIAMTHRDPWEDDAELAEVLARRKRLMSISERPQDALDPMIFSKESLREAELIYHCAYMSSWNLQPPPNSDAKGIEDFLVSRMMLRSIDVPHDPLFSWSQAQQV